MTSKVLLAGAIAASCLVAAISRARAETDTLIAYLTGSAAVPADATEAFGQARFTYDSETRRLVYLVTYDGLPGAQVEIHGPAEIGQNAPVLIPFPTPESPASGAVTLTRAEASALLAGKLYVDVHSGGYARGEIRGQIEKE